jgi:3D (Asp-Asp-Asp) domain-containing protein/uncharacterized protein YabE (DUF348 family)
VTRSSSSLGGELASSYRYCRHDDATFSPSGKETGIGRDISSSSITKIGVLSLGLIVPISAGPFTERAITALTSSVEGPTKTVVFVRDGRSTTLHTRALDVDGLLAEEHVVRSADDLLDAAPDAPVVDGETIHYRAARSITLVVDGIPQTIRSTAPTVGELLAERKIAYDRHDAIVPAVDTNLDPVETVDVEHVASWIERQDRAIAPPVHHVASLSLALGSTKVVAAGLPGIRETSYLVVRTANRTAPPIRTIIASRVLRPARPRIIAAGIGEYAAFANLAIRGFDGTIRLAKAAIAMVATAYTGNCYGCSGVTKIGAPAGHGIVAVDPRVIPLGTHLYIPGYGHALAGDTGGAIHGNRIDLGFNSSADAMQFGRRAVVVYVLHR